MRRHLAQAIAPGTPLHTAAGPIPDGHGFAWHRFGGEITGWASFGGLTIPSAGRLGWHPGGDRFTQGEFFRYRITALQPAGPGAGSR